MLRPGRLDKTLYVGLPNEEDREDILRTLTKVRAAFATVKSKNGNRSIVTHCRNEGKLPFFFFALIRSGSTLVSYIDRICKSPTPVFFLLSFFSGLPSLKKIFVDRHKFCQPSWGWLNVTAWAFKPGFQMILSIAPVVSNNVQRRSGRLYGSTTQTIANDPGHWDDLDRLERTDFYDWSDPDDNAKTRLKTEWEETGRRHHRLSRDQGMREVTSPVPMREVSSSRPDLLPASLQHYNIRFASTNAFHFA